jgi:hypothetical protein
MYYYIPENIDLSIHMSEIGSNIHLEKYFYFLSLLSEMRVRYKNYKNSDFIKLKSVYLRNIMTSNKSRKIIRNLQKWGYI